MLYLDGPIGPIRGLMIYKDHEDPDLFYYVPERPRLALNEGVPEFLFLKYRRDITDNPDFDPDAGDQSLGGGFMAFTVDLGVDDRTLGAIKGELSQFAEGDVKLVPIQFRKGTVRLSIVKDAAEDPPDGGTPEPAARKGLKLYEEVYGATQPSLFGFNRATFALMLDREAATLMEAGIRTGISPIGVIYNLEFLGLRPGFRIKIRAEYKRVYETLEAELGARGSVGMVSLAADIGVAFQKLRDNGSVQIEVMNFTDDEDLKQKADEAWQWFQTKLLEDFFQSALEPPSFMTRQSGNLGMLGQLQSLFGGLSGPQTGTALAPPMGAPTTATPTTAPAAHGPSEGVPSTSTINRTAASANAGSGGASGPAGNASIAPFQVAFSLKFVHQDELQVRTFDYNLQAAEARTAAPNGMFGTVVAGFNLANRIRMVDLDDSFFKRLIATVSMGTDLAQAGIASVAVNLEYPGERPAGQPAQHVDGFLFQPGKTDPRTFTTFLNERGDLNYRYKLDITFAPNSEWTAANSQVSTPWVVEQARQLVIAPLDHVELLDVEVSLGDMDSGEITQVEVELVYDDPVHAFHVEKTLLLKPGEATKHWKLRLSDNATRSFRYRARYFLKSGNLRVQEDWVTTADPALIINEPFEGELNIRLIPLLDQNNLMEAVVDIRYKEAASGYRRDFQEIYDETRLDRRSLRIPTLTPEPPPFTYETTVVRGDGSVFESGELAADGNVAVILDGVGVTQRVRVRLPQASLGTLIAVKVDLQGPGDEPDVASVLFTPSQLEEKTVVLVQPPSAGGGPFTYRFSVTGYNNLGQPVPGQSGQQTGPALIVPMPG
ncbi:MAG: hypothetical protein A2W72_15860 [Burkholderiales bacterium RIFCSPLOWO2_12_67_14]|nr:MAG: hypothetical protein A3I64_23860 [Burkholderiales bacterium RIFCSPLOWO2_02_FULL_67_64]OGB43899.1 MAG: hypothetical protein A3E51_20455 [Burkholderiales bacterium RIFCSPHIGHO2_12_FULL_67_38]OGB49030.1 MAG: hypothetical protein A2W72_15860 [Burkholderiales bacterium RIFCSPLOWO2_12_67_14]